MMIQTNNKNEPRTTSMAFTKVVRGEQGFVALITAIVLSCILITAAVTLNMSGFFTRSSLLDSEYKERSSALSEACADVALLKLASDPSYAGNETMAVGTDTCQTRATKLGVPVAGQDTVETRGVFNEATTNLRIVVETSNLSVQSWDELPSF